MPYRTTERSAPSAQSIGLLQLAFCVAGSLLNWSGQCIGTVAGGQCQTGQGRYVGAVTCGCVDDVGEERKKERQSATSQCHAQQALTLSVTHNGGKGMNIYCK